MHNEPAADPGDDITVKKRTALRQTILANNMMVGYPTWNRICDILERAHTVNAIARHASLPGPRGAGRSETGRSETDNSETEHSEGVAACLILPTGLPSCASCLAPTCAGSARPRESPPGRLLARSARQSPRSAASSSAGTRSAKSTCLTC